ncbi:MAG: universal stress protein [Gallionellaceae bacterium]
MYQRILVAVDGSTTSDLALKEAIGLAKDQHAILRIVYVVDEVSLYGDAQFVDRSEIEKAWIKTGHEILAKAQSSARLAGINAEIKLLETENVGERIADAIVEEAKAWPADLLVAATHGRTGLTHLLMGSVAEGIVRISPAPILLVHAK